MVEGSPGKFGFSPPRLYSPPKDEILPPSTGPWNLHCQGFCCTFPVYVVQMGILGTCHRAGGGRERLLRNLEAPLALVLSGLGEVGLAFPGSARSGRGQGLGAKEGELDSAKEQGITGILLNWRDPTEYKGRGFVSPSLLHFLCLQRSQGFQSQSRW